MGSVGDASEHAAHLPRARLGQVASDLLVALRRLVQRYRDLPLDLADGAVIACAERSGGVVLTLDLRDFGVVAREGSITLLPG